MTSIRIVRTIAVTTILTALASPALAGGKPAPKPAGDPQINVQGQAQGQYQGQSQSQVQSQSQSQAQSQAQGQLQNNDQTISPSQSVKFEGTSFERYAPPAMAPGLTAAGTGVCLGSVSIGASGPMAGLSFGITKVDKGCEQRSAAALLYQFGYPEAAVRLLMKNDDVREAMEAAGVRPVFSPMGEKQAAALTVTPAAIFGMEHGQ